MTRFLLALAAAAALASAAAAQPAAPTQPAPPSDDRFWAISETEIASVPARTSFPRQAGVVAAVRHQEFSHQGEGLDNGIQYRSPDGAVFATVYIYFPGLAHAGLAAVATGESIGENSQSDVTGGALRVVDAGGRTGVALRADYAGYRGNLVSSAAWIKAGRWIVKLRVSGPADRRAEVMAAMDALLGELRFGAANPAFRAPPIAVSPCAADAGATPARLLPAPPALELSAQGILATFDGGGITGTDESGAPAVLPARVPERFCRASLARRQGRVTILRAEPGPARSVDGRTMLVVIINDAGTLLELVKADNLGGHVLLYHEIGRSTVLMRYDGVPSDTQIVEMLDTPDHPAMRVLVPVDLRPNEGPQIHLPPVENGQQPPRT